MGKRNKTSNPDIVDTQRQGITSVSPGKEYLAGNTNGRQTAGVGYAQGSKVDDVSAKEFQGGLARKKGNSKGGSLDGMGAGTRNRRSPVTQDRLGPRFSIQAKLPGPQAPEASLVQRNTKFVPSAVNRSNPNFNYGRQG